MGARGGEHARDLADQMAGHVDHVAADVGAAAAARDRLLQPPGDRHRRVEPVVVEEMAAVVDDLAELAGRDQLPGEGGPGPFAVDEAHLMRPPARGRRPVHGLGRLEGVGERLLAEHVLAVGEGVLADLGMGVVGRQHQHEIDVGGAGHVPPVPAELPPAPGCRGPLPELGIEVGHAPEVDRGQIRRQPVHGAEREGIGARHEAAADHADPDRRHRRSPPPRGGHPGPSGPGFEGRERFRPWQDSGCEPASPRVASPDRRGESGHWGSASSRIGGGPWLQLPRPKRSRRSGGGSSRSPGPRSRRRSTSGVMRPPGRC